MLIREVPQYQRPGNGGGSDNASPVALYFFDGGINGGRAYRESIACRGMYS